MTTVILSISIVLIIAALYRLGQEKERIDYLYEAMINHTERITEHEQYIHMLRIESELFELDEKLKEAEENDEYEICRELRLKIYKLEEQLKEL